MVLRSVYDRYDFLFHHFYQSSDATITIGTYVQIIDGSRDQKEAHMRDALAEPSTLFVRFVLRIHSIAGDSDGDSDGIALIGSL